MTPASRTLSTADERRETVLETAGKVFAVRGFHGTPTAEIAKEAGISQAYLFRLFPTKLELFVALVERCFERTGATFAEAAARARRTGESPLAAMGDAYARMVTEDRDALLMQLQAHAATSEPEIREAVRRGFGRLYGIVSEVSDATPQEIQAWFATGMLINVLAAMRADDLDEPWARALCQWDEPV
ncbi:MAG TPA: TetR/AcrR family transcriptional regulator [Capillimicrobium sp.]|nr:TetR/AcrR family transcriptional regulator [Capillimicrobium sp.]